MLTETPVPLVIQPERLSVPRSTRMRYRALFALDAAILVMMAGLAAAGVAVGSAVGAVMVFVAVLMAAMAIIGFATGIPSYRMLDRVERGRVPLLWAEARDSFVVLTPGPRPKRSKELLVVPGAMVNVDVAPNLRHSLFYVVLALKWTISCEGRSTRFTTFFEPDPAFFDEVGRALADTGLHPAFTYRPLSHSFYFADM
ncbi:hypothetical protein LGT39_08025 [Demequina sp. TTPB684]|uniref:hypothetical protein n=1 Tax=unclassified Demequina TaxID=2620311 RepID=UPI001CF3AFAF|nr:MULTISPECIES: hypothetical protein [unclassified Demequina]MCB2412791.1 hypothetical protein [Demequina sp. TTPB684]UPU87138.1 hypothetical protein LGT36_007560 [Demequina sp. TMPB413]